MKSQPQTLTALSLALALLLGVFILTRSPPFSSTQVTPSSTHEKPPLSSAQPFSNPHHQEPSPLLTQRRPHKTNEPSAAPPLATPLLAPSLARYQNEAALDPHHLPNVLAQFAQDLAERMELAKTSETYATQLMEEFDALITDPNQATPQSAKALSLKNAKTLAKKYPDLRPRLNSILGRTQPEIIQLAHDESE